MRICLITLILVFLLPPITFAADSNGNYAVWGVGKKSCFKYIKARENNEYDAYSNYIKGFLTAYNMIEKDTYNITGNKPFNEILDWLDDECELKQMNPLEQALLELIDDNFEKRAKKARSSAGR